MRDLHGNQVVYSDKAGVYAPLPLEWDALNAKIKAQVAQLLARFEKKFCAAICLTPSLFIKASLCNSITNCCEFNLIQHGIIGMCYLKYVVSAENHTKLTSTAYVTVLDNLQDKQIKAHAWFNDLATQLPTIYK
ncbi:MAG: hypothetical protein ACPG8W_10310 [Candidatus Promineifilaceae bacterium]